jgi:hypothetical protein
MIDTSAFAPQFSSWRLWLWVFSDVRVHAEQRVGVESVLITGGDAPGHDPLTLILAELVVAVGYLKPVSGRKQVEVQDVAGAGPVVEPVEYRLVVPHVVEGGELGRIQEPAGPQAVGCQKIPYLLVSEADRRAAARGTEGAVRRIETAKDLAGAEPRTRGDLGDQAALVAEFGVRRAGNGFHALDRGGGQLGGKHLALLIADPLAVDHETDLRVVAQGVKEPVRIGDRPARAVNDGLAKPPGRIEERQLIDEAPVHIDVRGRIGLQHAFPGGLHRNARLRSGERQRDLELKRHGPLDGRLLRGLGEAWGAHFQAVRIGRDVDQPERPVVRGNGGLLIARYPIRERHLGACHHRAGWVENRSLNGPGVAQRLRRRRYGCG